MQLPALSRLFNPRRVCACALVCASWQGQVAAFRKIELQECLERLGLKKLGNKAELQQRLLALFSDYDHL